MKVATWNIAGGRKLRTATTFDYDQIDLPYFVEQLKILDCDIICLQESELRSESDYSMAKDIAEQLGFEYIFESPGHPSHIEAGTELSLAILSKHPFENAINIEQPYPSFEVTLPNGQPAQKHMKYLQSVMIDGLHVANTHAQPLEFLGTPYESPRGKQYAKQVNSLFIKELARPLIFPGDFSADLHTTHVSTIFADMCKAFQLTDVLPPGQTKPFQKGRPDAIFVSPELSNINSGIIETSTDHFLCWAELSHSS